MEIRAMEKKILIDPLSLEKLRHWVLMAKGEISGLGIVVDKGDHFEVTDVFLPEQVCTSAGTELSDEAVASLMCELELRGVDSGGLRFWWHSHADMKVFWSDTDCATIEGLMNESYFLSAVFNKRGDILARVDLFKPARVVMNDITLEPLLPNYRTMGECLNEFRQKVSEQTLLKRNKEKREVTLDDYDEWFDTDDAYDPYGVNDYWAAKLNRGEITMAEYQEATGISAEKLLEGGAP